MFANNTNLALWRRRYLFVIVSIEGRAMTATFHKKFLSINSAIWIDDDFKCYEKYFLRLKDKLGDNIR